jgi:SAM-dependent methyltransferase
VAQRRIQKETWYNCPLYYDVAFQGDTQREADFVEAAGRKYCPFPVKKILEPACGTGRLVRELAARGHRLTGFDLNRPSLDFLRERLKERGLRARTFVGDMADFHLPSPVDVAFCTVNTFRLLLTEDAARRHLECVAASLRTGGIYILGFHLLPPDVSEESTERWTESASGIRVTTTLRVLTTDRRRRVETLRTSLLVREHGQEKRLRDEFQFRMYTAAQFRRLLACVPSLRLRDVYDFWYEIDEPQKLDNQITDTVFILQKQ